MYETTQESPRLKPLPTKIKEEWRRIADGYFISNKGRVYSAKSEKCLKAMANSAGYPRVKLYLKGKSKMMPIHIKVVEHFGDRNGKRLEPRVVALNSLRGEGLSIDHFDRNKNNNRVTNLEIVTHSENCLRKFRKKGEFKNGN